MVIDIKKIHTGEYLGYLKIYDTTIYASVSNDITTLINELKNILIKYDRGNTK